MDNLPKNEFFNSSLNVTTHLLRDLKILLGSSVRLEEISLLNRGLSDIISGRVLSLDFDSALEQLKQVLIQDSSGKVYKLTSNDCSKANSNSLFYVKGKSSANQLVEVQACNLIDFYKLFHEAMKESLNVEVMYSECTKRINLLQLSKAPDQEQLLSNNLTSIDSEYPVLHHFPLPILICFEGQFTETQKNIFSLAAQRWGQILYGNLPQAEVNGELIDGLVVTAAGIPLDGQGTILARATPQYLRVGTLIPATGRMEFDIADLADMEEQGTLFDVVFHEIAHILGFGTLWEDMGLINNNDKNNPVFIGENAMQEFANMLNVNSPIPVPIENLGRPGVHENHWRDSIFGNEIMTSFIQSANCPISRLTIAAFKDMGFTVNFKAADSYNIKQQLKFH